MPVTGDKHGILLLQPSSVTRVPRLTPRETSDTPELKDRLETPDRSPSKLSVTRNRRSLRNGHSQEQPEGTGRGLQEVSVDGTMRGLCAFRSVLL